MFWCSCILNVSALIGIVVNSWNSSAQCLISLEYNVTLRNSRLLWRSQVIAARNAEHGSVRSSCALTKASIYLECLFSNRIWLENTGGPSSTPSPWNNSDAEEAVTDPTGVFRVHSLKMGALEVILRYILYTQTTWLSYIRNQSGKAVNLSSWNVHSYIFNFKHDALRLVLSKHLL